MAEKPAAWAVAMAQSATASEAQRHHRRAPRFKNVIVELPQSGWEHVRGQEWTGGPRGYPACPTSRTVPTRLAAGRRALLPPPPARRRDPSPAPWAIRWPACGNGRACASPSRSEEHTSELQSLRHLVCRLLLEKKHEIIRSDPKNPVPNSPHISAPASSHL